MVRIIDGPSIGTTETAWRSVTNALPLPFAAAGDMP
jgi:hypothetical protein